MCHCFTFTVFPNLFVGFWLRIFNFNLSGCIERNLAWFLQCNTIYKYLWTWSNSFFPDHMYHQSIQFIVFITLPEYFSLSAFVLSSLKTLNILLSLIIRFPSIIFVNSIVKGCRIVRYHLFSLFHTPCVINFLISHIKECSRHFIIKFSLL